MAGSLPRRRGPSAAAPGPDTTPASTEQLSARLDALTEIMLRAAGRGTQFRDIRAWCVELGLPVSRADQIAAALTGQQP